MYKLIEDYQLKKLIESNLIYNELIALGVDNWNGYDEINFPTIEEIEEDFNNFINAETLSIKDGDTIYMTVDPDIVPLDICNLFHKKIQNLYPNNKILVSVKGIEITIGEN